MWICFFLGVIGALDPEDGVSHRREHSVEITSVKQLNFILVYKEHIGWGSLETNPNLHEVAHSYHRSS